MMEQYPLAPRPKGLNYKGKKQLLFQQQGLHFMIDRETYQVDKFLGGAQCAPIGSGKTFVTIMLCATHLLDREETKKLFELQNTKKVYCPVNLVVCPDSVKSHWQAEIRSVWPSARVFHFSRKGKMGQFVRDGTPYSIGDLHANSFVLISWDCLAQEMHYANAFDSGTQVFSLASRYWGRIIFDEGHLSGTHHCLKFKMCNKFQSLFRWCQTATPKDVKDVARFLRVQDMDDIIWQPPVKEVEAQMSCTPIISKNVPISFSLVETEYYNYAKLNDIEKQNFCKENPYAETTLKVFVIEMLRYQIEILKEQQVSALYDLSLHQYFVEKDEKLAIKTLNSALQISIDKSKYLLTLDEPHWKKRVAKIITTLLFFGDFNPDLIQLQENNVKEYVTTSPKCIPLIDAQKSTMLLHSEFKKTCKSKCSRTMMDIWMKYVEIEMLQDIKKLDTQWSKEQKTSCEEYDHLHKRLEEINAATNMKMSCHLDPTSFTLYQKLSVVLGHVHRKFMLGRDRSKVQVVYEFCLMTDYEKLGQISKEMISNALRYKGKMAEQLKKWKRFKKTGEKNPFTRVKMDPSTINSENCQAKYKALLQKHDVMDEVADCIKIIIDLQANFNLLSDVSELTEIQRENSETIKSLSEFKPKPLVYFDIDVLQQKVKHFDEVVPKLLVKCLGCSHDFGRNCIPVRFNACKHHMCYECENKRLDSMNPYQVEKERTCPICNVESFREIDREIPIGMKISDLYAPPLIEKPDKKWTKNQVPNGCKIPRIVDLIHTLIQNPQLQADGTNYSNIVDYRKIVVFDSNPKFRKSMFENLHGKVFLFENHKNDSKSLDEFKSVKGSAILILNIFGNDGVHLPQADTVILCAPEDESVELQAIGRIHRLGQIRPVSVYHCYIENSIEEEHLPIDFSQEDEDCVLRGEQPECVQILQDDYFLDNHEVEQDLTGDQPMEPNEVIEIHDDELKEPKEEKIPPIQSMLKDLQLEEHWQEFQTEKYEQLEDLFELSHQDLDRLNVPRGRRGRIFNYLENHNVKRQKRE